MFPLVDAAWLAVQLGAKSSVKQADLRVIDVRWYLRGKQGRSEYGAGHIPGAVFVDLDHALAADPKIGPGRHPLPSTDAFEAAMREAGVNDATTVIAYDDASGSIAARLWWLLRHFGHAQVAVLDGGLAAWTQNGGSLETEPPAVAPGTFRAQPVRGERGVVDRAGVTQALAAGALVIDARSRDRYRGDSEPIDARPGHVPGAVNAPWTENVADGKFLDAAALAEKYRALGADEARGVIAYCGSGVTACHDLLALEIAGIQGAKLYEGSWSDWASQPNLPAATGDDPGKL